MNQWKNKNELVNYLVRRVLGSVDREKELEESVRLILGLVYSRTNRDIGDDEKIDIILQLIEEVISSDYVEDGILKKSNDDRAFQEYLRKLKAAAKAKKSKR